MTTMCVCVVCMCLDEDYHHLFPASFKRIKKIKNPLRYFVTPSAENGKMWPCSAFWRTRRLSS